MTFQKLDLTTLQKNQETNKESISRDILSDIVVHMKYARHLPLVSRRETWEEIVTRNMDMHIKKYPTMELEIRKNYEYVFDKKVLPSMRSLQFGGKPVELNNSRLYNCSYLPMDSQEAFSEIMFLLLSGAGVGYSVQTHHVKKLPPVRKLLQDRKKKYLIGDSIEGWSDAIKVLMKSYFNGTKEIDFDYRDIRAKGERLITSGGKAPGPQPLKDCVHNIRKVMDNALIERGDGAQLKPIEVHDILCYIADAVLSGGIRRSAMISLFSLKDNEMFQCKFNHWYELNPQRARANNSVVLLRDRIKEEDFFQIWEKIKASGSGEPGIFFTNDREWGANPCLEVSLRANQFCNLATINSAVIKTQEDLNNSARAATFIGTLQAGYTDFHYLRDVWQETTEKEALVGVSMTGIANEGLLKLNLQEASSVVLNENERVAKLIGINKAARSCVIKPEGTSSLVLGTSSGIHAWHGEYYFRRLRVGKNEAIYHYLKHAIPSMIEDDYFKPDIQAIITVPVKAPEGAILRTESPINLLDRVKRFHEDWIKPGHRAGVNSNNVSTTVTIKDDEWDSVGRWMWENRDSYNGLSVLPYDGGTYIQAPFEECTKEQYEELLEKVRNIDLTKVKEEDDNTKLSEELACAGDSCAVVSL